MRQIAAALFVALLAACAHRPPEVAGQAAEAGVEVQMRRAEEAFERGDRKTAEEGYRSVLRLQPDTPRALFRLGQLAPAGSPDAIAHLRRYTQLQPTNVAGFIALGDALARSGSTDEALAQYARARSINPNEPEILAAEVRTLRNAGRVDALMQRLNDETTRRPYNAAGWIELGRTLQRVGRHAEAVSAFARAQEIAPSAQTLEMMDAALSRGAPSVRPYAGASEDSDKNRIKRAGADLLLPVGPTRVGVSIERADVSDPVSTGTADRIAMPVQWIPNHAWRIESSAGIVRLKASDQRPDDRWIGHAGVRWRESLHSAAAELSLSRQPLLASPRLLAHPVDVNQARAMVEWPLTRHWITRLQGEAATLEEEDQTNRRTGGRGSLMLRFQPGLQLQASGGTLSYQRPTRAGYSAPRRTVSGELGLGFEVSRFWPVYLAVDTAVGGQRITNFGASPGPWKGTFRWFSSIGLELWPGAELALDIEHDNTIEQRAVDAPADQWRSTSAMLSLRFGVWRQDRPVFTAPQSSGALRRTH